MTPLTMEALVSVESACFKLSSVSTAVPTNTLIALSMSDAAILSVSGASSRRRSVFEQEASKRISAFVGLPSPSKDLASIGSDSTSGVESDGPKRLDLERSGLFWLWGICRHKPICPFFCNILLNLEERIS